MQALFAAIVADLTTVRDAYAAAGLLGEAAAGSLALALFGSEDEAERFRRDVLLADALLRNRVARLVHRRRGPRHVVAFGGNNVGKSTVVNVLAAAPIAGTSPEGGHTRHAHGFAADAASPFAADAYAFRDFQRVPADQLSDAAFDCFAVSIVPPGTLPDHVVLWDSPDCDSVGSLRYLPAVVETATIADLLVYVTSVEKYAVNDLVEWVVALSDAGIPVLCCLNKTPRRDRPLVLRKQQEEVLPAVARRLGRPAPFLRAVALRTMTEGEEADLWGPDHAEAAELRNVVLAALSTGDDDDPGDGIRNGPAAAAAEHRPASERPPAPERPASERPVSERPAARPALDRRDRQALRSVTARIDGVVAPARAELAVRQAWTARVSEAVTAFVATYEQAYLAGDSVIEPFNKLNVQLLDLLNPDIPGLTEIMRSLRTMRRLPVDLLKAGWRLLADPGDAAEPAVAPELAAYGQAHRALLRAVHDTIAAERETARHHPFWDRLAEAWTRQAAALADAFQAAAERHIEQTDAEIRVAARDILRALEQRPGVLRLLRGVRLSTEMGGLVVGFVLPGHGHIGHDLLDRMVIAPLLMSATGAAADFAVEGYVAQRRREIVEKLRTEARDMALSLYAAPLHAIAEDTLNRLGTLGLGQDLLDRLPANLARLQAAVDEAGAA